MLALAADPRKSPDLASVERRRAHRGVAPSPQQLLVEPVILPVPGWAASTSGRGVEARTVCRNLPSTFIRTSIGSEVLRSIAQLATRSRPLLVLTTSRCPNGLPPGPGTGSGFDLVPIRSSRSAEGRPRRNRARRAAAC